MSCIQAECDTVSSPLDVLLCFYMPHVIDCVMEKYCAAAGPKITSFALNQLIHYASLKLEV